MLRRHAAIRSGPVLAAFVVFLAGFAGAHVSAAMFEQMQDAIVAVDRDGNGGIDRPEWKTAGLRTFIGLDRDGDGNISLEEFMVFRSAVFAVVDADHDGLMTADEADAYKRLPWTLGLAR